MRDSKHERDSACHCCLEDGRSHMAMNSSPWKPRAPPVPLAQQPARKRASARTLRVRCELESSQTNSPISAFSDSQQRIQPSHQNCEIINECCFKPLSVWKRVSYAGKKLMQEESFSVLHQDARAPGPGAGRPGSVRGCRAGVGSSQVLMNYLR